MNKKIVKKTHHNLPLYVKSIQKTPNKKISSLFNQISSSIKKSKQKTRSSHKKFQKEKPLTSRNVNQRHRNTTPNISVSNTNQSDFMNPEEQLMKLKWKKMKKPATSSAVIKKFSKSLTDYEKSEILSYKEVYYFGLNIVKIVPSSPNNKGEDVYNQGYDDKS